MKKKQEIKKLQVKRILEGANKYLSTPLIPGEIVIIVSIEEDPNFMTIEHNNGKSISKFHKCHFEEVKVN